MKVAMSSDNHFDVDRIDYHDVIEEQAEVLLKNDVEVYLIAGDLFNDFEKSQQYLDDLQRILGDRVKVLFIAGNHDMLHNVTYDQLESDLGDWYLHNKFYDIPGTNWRILGNNGWYDYSLASNLPQRTSEDFWHWKKAFWIDSSIEQPTNDIERMNVVLKQFEQQLQIAENKQVLVMTHFAPRSEYIRFTNDNRFWNMANGMMGSSRLGELFEKCQPDKVLFGHLHHNFPELDVKNTTYYNQAVGYNNKRINEWRYQPFMSQWAFKLKILDLK
ncbi:metallophosphoesterase [Pediococcus argentinicus]|uniref:metallophosphoesterase n=1 Tax=Pediococcus argentinicus TaxID=480391 RepID=UPI00338DD2B9